MTRLEKMSIRLGLAGVAILVAGLAFLVVNSYMDGKKAERKRMADRLTTLSRTLSTSVENMMITGNAAIVPDWAKGIKQTNGLAAVQVLRKSGVESFSDNETIHTVNQWLGSKAFVDKDEGFFEPGPDFDGFNLHPVDKKKLARAVKTVDPFTYYETLNGGPVLTMLYPIKNREACHTCHGYDETPVRGIIRVSISTHDMEEELERMLNAQLSLAGFTGVGIVILFSVYAVILLRRLRKGEEQLRISAKVFDNAVEGIIVTDADARIVSVNAAFTQVTGYGPEEVVGRNPRLLKSGRHDPRFYENMWRQIKEQGQWVGEIWNRRKDGEEFPEHLSITAIRDDKGKVVQYAGIFNDISERKKQEEMIQYMAFHDNLTGLPNRRTFSKLVDVELAHAKRYDYMTAVMFMDLDGFKQINDTHGHDVGDMVLQTVSERIKDSLREGDTVARMGGDEFTVLLPQVKGERDATLVAEKMVEIINRDMFVGERTLHVGTSIGIAFYPRDGEDPETLIKKADTAMYEAKQGGKNRWVIYYPQEK